MRTKIIFSLLLIIGLSLTIINVYGLFQEIRPQSINNDNLRFINDQPISYQDSITQLVKKDKENDIDFAHRSTSVIAKSLAHIHWEEYEPQKFNQLVPIWENYFLYFMGKFSGIPEFERYHFADYQRSLKRGVGICGDASMVLSQVLTNNNINNKILTYPEHVVVSANFNTGENHILDADFGVSIPFNKDTTAQNHFAIAQLYTDQGYTEADRRFFQRMYQTSYTEWQNVKHFITKKYYFEKLSYWLKWPLPFFMILFAVYLLKYSSRRKG